VTFQKGHPPYRKADIDRQPSPPVVTKAVRPVAPVAPPPEPVKVVRRRKAKPVRRVRAVAQVQAPMPVQEKPKTVRRGLLWAWRERRAKRQEEKRVIAAERLAAKDTAKAKSAAAKAERLKEAKVKVKVKHDLKRPLIMGAGAVAIVLGIGTGYLWYTSQVSLMAFVAAALIIGGGIAVYLARDMVSNSNVVIGADKKKFVLAPANSMNIYPDPVGVKFEQVEQPLGPLHPNRDDGKAYYVHIEESAFGGVCGAKVVDHGGAKLKALVLPDEVYCPPESLAIAATMQGHAELVMKESTLLDKIAPFALVIVFIFEFIFGVVLLSKTPSQAGNTTIANSVIYADNSTIAGQVR